MTIVRFQFLHRARATKRQLKVCQKGFFCESLIATTPGEEGKWFATAKELELYELALELANRSPCDPKTLTRAARDYLDTAPEFALGSAMAALLWLIEGGGDEVTSIDVVEAYVRAAPRLCPEPLGGTDRLEGPGRRWAKCQGAYLGTAGDRPSGTAHYQPGAWP